MKDCGTFGGKVDEPRNRFAASVILGLVVVFVVAVDDEDESTYQAFSIFIIIHLKSIKNPRFVRSIKMASIVLR